MLSQYLETCFEPSHQRTHSVKVTMIQKMLDPRFESSRTIRDNNTLLPKPLAITEVSSFELIKW